MSTAINSKCAKCGEDIGDNSLYIGGNLYHPQCSPYTAEPDRSSAEPENQPEALDRELSRLIGEYMDDDAGDSTKEEAWNMIADFTVDNTKTIIAALATLAPQAAVEGEAVASDLPDILRRIVKAYADVIAPLAKESIVEAANIIEAR